MVVAADKVFWGFLFWIKHNPYKTIEAMKSDDLYEMAKQFAAVNVTSAGLTVATDKESANQGFGVVDFSTDVDFPKYAAATRYATNGNGVDASTTVALNETACAQSLYPDQHI